LPAGAKPHSLKSLPKIPLNNRDWQVPNIYVSKTFKELFGSDSASTEICGSISRSINEIPESSSKFKESETQRER